LIDDIQLVGFPCASACAVMERRTVLPVNAVSSSASFFACLMTELAVIAYVDFTSVRDYCVIEELLHALARVARVKLADEHTPNALLQ
jgi:hypothetical protein